MSLDWEGFCSLSKKTMQIRKIIDPFHYLVGKNSILALLDAVDNNVPDPVRNFDEPFLLPIEHVHTITGR
jgi:translation elongation factor EF-Tu-like GTPase